MAETVDIRTGVLFEVDPNITRVKRMRRRVFAWAQAMSASAPTDGEPWHLHMVTLTYRPRVKWGPNDIRDALLRARKYYGADLVGYAWVAELMQSGKLHYHVLTVTQTKRRLFWDRKQFWRHGSSNVIEARSWGYVVKYAQKTETGAGYPRGARMFAVWASSRAIGEAQRHILADSAQPNWARAHRDSVAPGSRIRGLADGQRVIGGEAYRSPFAPVGALAEIALKRLGPARWAELLEDKRRCWGLCQVMSQAYNGLNQTSDDQLEQGAGNVVLLAEGARPVAGPEYHQHALLPR